MSNNELFQALQLFQKGVQDFGIAQGINQATQAVQQVRNSQVDEVQKRQQLDALGRDLALRLTGLGASGTQIQSAFQSIAPTPINSAEDAYLQGEMTGSQQLKTIGKKTQDFNYAPKFADREDQQKFQAEQNDLDRQFKLDAVTTKQSTPKTKALSDKHVDELASIDDDVNLGSSLLAEVAQSPWLVGPAAGRIPGRGTIDPKFASFNQAVTSWFDSYRQKVTGAGASDQEIKRLEANRPNPKDSPSQFQAKVERIMSVGKDIRRRKLITLKKSGRDVSAFLADEEASQPAAEAAPAPTVDKSKFFY